MLLLFYFAIGALFVSGAPPVASPNNPASAAANDNGHPVVCPHLKRLEVVPGRGWDNLRNKDLGAVTATTYNLCKTTEDGEYLIPDNVFVIPVKQSNLQLSSDMFEHWLNYSSLTASSFRLNAGGTLFGKVAIEGSFSADFENAKRRQVRDKSITTRVSVRNTLYTVGLEPTAAIDPGLKKLFESAIAELKNNNTEKVNVIMEFIVRDYGTHYTTYLEAGAILSKEDFVSMKFVQDNWASKSSINAAASATFSSVFSFGFSTHNSFTESFLEGYQNSITSSTIRSYGGGLVKYNMSVNQWVDSIPNNLVAVDRSGNPLHFIISPTTFPEVPLKLLLRLRNELGQTIQQYYAYNTHTGCLDRNSLNFDFMANVDDGSCKSPIDNYTLGGVFQTCQSPYTGAGDLCTELSQKNPITKGFSCPSGFIAVLLNTGEKKNQYSETKYGQECHGAWFWKHCDLVSWQENHYSESHYQSYWCVASVFPVPANTGFVFGGVYTTFLNNPLTREKSCPPFFYPLRMGIELQVCVSIDYQMAKSAAVQLGGFFSCSQGNPLLLNNTVVVPAGGYPRGCPDGHTQHMAAIDNDCEINYCVPANTFLEAGQIPIVLPPFSDPTGLFQNVTLALTMSAADEISEEPNVSSGGIAGIIISCTAVVAIVGGIIIWRKKKRNAAYRSGSYGPIGEESPLINDQANASSQQEASQPI